MRKLRVMEIVTWLPLFIRSWFSSLHARMLHGHWTKTLANGLKLTQPKSWYRLLNSIIQEIVIEYLPYAGNIWWPKQTPSPSSQKLDVAGKSYINNNRWYDRESIMLEKLVAGAPSLIYGTGNLLVGSEVYAEPEMWKLNRERREKSTQR